VCKRDDPNFVGSKLIDDAVRKAPERKAACAATPDGAKPRVGAKDADRALELGNECKSELGICFSRVVEGSVNQLALSLETDGCDHFTA
jgi:hypothetical protein